MITAFLSNLDLRSDIDSATVEVYRNLTKKTLSVRSNDTGRVVKHTNSIYLTHCRFVVGKKGRLRVLKEKQKNVHAFVRGKELFIHSTDNTFSMPFDGWTKRKIIYNPYLYDSFMYVSADGKTILNKVGVVPPVDVVFITHLGEIIQYSALK